MPRGGARANLLLATMFAGHGGGGGVDVKPTHLENLADK